MSRRSSVPSFTRQGSRGQALTEFALLLPLLIVALALTAEIGRSFFIAEQMTNANREGALWAGHHFPDCSTCPNGITASNSPCSAGVPNDTAADFKRNVICVIRGEETAPRIGCPVANQSYVVTPDPDAASPPFNTWQPAPGSKATLTIEVDCAVQPLVALRPLPTTYKVASKVTTYVFN